MEGQKNKYDPRFYFIAINSLKLFKQPEEDISLLFRLGSKKSDSKYSVDSVVTCEEGYQLVEGEAQREVHILKYGAQQFLNIFVKAGATLNSYCRILLPPLQEHPHTKHTVTAKLIHNIFHAAENINQDPAPSGQVSLDIYFQFNFAGSLEVIPVSAQLERDIAQIGEMKPRVRLELEEQTWTSLQAEGGIHPHWSGHFHSNRNKNKGLIESIELNLKNNKLEQWARLLKMASNSLGITSKNQERTRESTVSYFDCTDFTMRSAGSYMKVEIISDPFLGSKPDVIGTARIRVEDEGLLKYPRKENEKLFQEKLVNLFHLDQATGQEVTVGVLKLYVRFVFDKERVVEKKQTYQLL